MCSRQMALRSAGARLDEATALVVEHDLAPRRGGKIEQLGSLGHDEDSAEVTVCLGGDAGDVAPAAVGVEVFQQTLDLTGRRFRKRLEGCFVFENLTERFVHLVAEEFAPVGNP